jgi:hypothetical protein
MLTEEEMEKTIARHEHSPRKSLTCLAQGTRFSDSSAQAATKILKLKPYKTIVLHELQPHTPVNSESVQLDSFFCS